MIVRTEGGTERLNQNSPDSTTLQASRAPKHSDAGAVVSRPPTARSEGTASADTAPSGASGAGKEPGSPCLECAALRDEVQELRISRDDALLALAKERELLQALRAKYSTAEHVFTAQEPPLRHVVVDKMNDTFKNQFAILHVGARRLLALFVGSTRKKG